MRIGGAAVVTLPSDIAEVEFPRVVACAVPFPPASPPPNKPILSASELYAKWPGV